MTKLAIVTCMCIAMMAVGQEKKMESKKADVTPRKAQGYEVAPELGSEKIQNNKAITLHGIVVDQMCAKSMAKKSDPMDRASKHDKDCALEEACAASGYGLLYDNGKWVKFDENGDKLARAMFESSKKDIDFKAEVTGEMKGDKLLVASLTETKRATDETKKPMKKD